jgi:transposase-like protein
MTCPNCNRATLVRLVQVIEATQAYSCEGCDHEWLTFESDPQPPSHVRQARSQSSAAAIRGNLSLINTFH